MVVIRINDSKRNEFYDEDSSRRKWLVLFGAFFNNVLIWGLAWGGGVFQVVFMEEFGAPGLSGLVSFIPTLVSAWTCLIGPVSSALTNRFGCRKITWAGAIIASGGLALTSFASRLWHLCITFTLIGIGTGLAYIPGSVLIVCQYFERRRPLALALASCGLGVGTFSMPPLIRRLINAYHWRGACLVLSALVLNMGTMATLYSPVKTKSVSAKIDEAGQEKKKIIRVKMLRQKSFGCLLLNNILIMYGVVAFYIHLPSYLDAVGYSDEAGAAFVSAIGASVLAGRIVCGSLAQRVKAADIIYSVTMALSGLVVALLPYTNRFEYLIVLCILFGFTTCTLGPLLPLIATDLVGIEALSDAYGYLMVAEGVGSLLGPPIAGFLYDISRNYVVAIGSSGLIMVLSSVVMLVPIFAVRRSRQKMLNNEKEAKPSSATFVTLLPDGDTTDNA